MNRSNLKQAFLIDSDAKLLPVHNSMYYFRLMKRLASEPGQLALKIEG